MNPIQVKLLIVDDSASMRAVSRLCDKVRRLVAALPAHSSPRQTERVRHLELMRS